MHLIGFLIFILPWNVRELGHSSKRALVWSKLRSLHLEWVAVQEITLRFVEPLHCQSSMYVVL